MILGARRVEPGSRRGPASDPPDAHRRNFIMRSVISSITSRKNGRRSISTLLLAGTALCSVVALGAGMGAFVPVGQIAAVDLTAPKTQRRTASPASPVRRRVNASPSAGRQNLTPGRRHDRQRRTCRGGPPTGEPTADLPLAEPPTPAVLSGPGTPGGGTSRRRPRDRPGHAGWPRCGRPRSGPRAARWVIPGTGTGGGLVGVGVGSGDNTGNWRAGRRGRQLRR